jgi:tetratricopeptide (TPR) repeat protein
MIANVLLLTGMVVAQQPQPAINQISSGSSSPNVTALQSRQSITQISYGWCSPNVVSSGPVTVSCIGVDPRALARLNVELNKRKLQLDDKIREANSWADRYKELERQLSDVGKDNKLWEEAETDLHAGDLEGAGDALDQLIAARDKDAAAAHFARGLVFRLEFRPLDALPQFATAYTLESTEPKYGFEYAHALFVQNDFKSALPVLTASRDRARQLATANPQIYQPDLADILNLLGIVYLRTDHTTEAERATREAVEVQRQVAQRDPTLLVAVVVNLINQAHLYSMTQRPEQAWRTYQEAGTLMNSLPQTGATELLLEELLTDLAVFLSSENRVDASDSAFRSALKLARQMAKNNPGYEPLLSRTLVLAARHHGDHGKVQDAETEFQEALEIQKRFAKENPAEYDPAVASTLNFMGRLFNAMHASGQAEAAYREALDIRLNLAKNNPDVFEKDVADTKFGLGGVYYVTGRYPEAEKAWIDARNVYNKHWKADPRSEGGELVLVLQNLALLYEKLGNLAEAASEANNALDVSRKLWTATPDLAGDLLAQSLLVVVQVRSGDPSAEVCALLSEAVKAAQSLAWKTKAGTEESSRCSQSSGNNTTGHQPAPSDADAKAIFRKVLASAYPREGLKDIRAVLIKQTGTRIVQGKVEQFSRETLRVLPDRIRIVVVSGSGATLRQVVTVVTPTMAYRISGGNTVDLPSSYAETVRTSMKFDLIYAAQHPDDFDVSLAGSEQIGENLLENLNISTAGESQIWEVDPATGRVFLTREKLPSGEETVNEYSDFRLTSGIYRAYKVSAKASGITIDFVIQEFIINPQVDDGLFVRPNTNN